MIPDAEDIARAYHRIAPELGVPPRASAAAIRVALREADHLAEDIYDVPAALLFALGRNPRCFAGFRAMSVLVVEWHTKTLGFKLEASREELANILVRVALRDLSYEDVRGWVVERMLPFGG
jgi:prophage maintenance system killer protein